MDPKRKRQQKEPTWQSIAREAQQHRDNSINLVAPPMPDLSRLSPENATLVPATVLSEQDLRLTELCSEDLLSEIASRKVTATTVASAFLRRAAIAQKLVGYPFPATNLCYRSPYV